MTADLKPCPFCGAEAEMDTQQGYRTVRTDELGTRVVIYCNGCGAEAGECREDHPGVHLEDLIEAVAGRWNARAATTAPAREALIKHMTDRFLCWRLPQDFRPDNGISYTRPNYAPEFDATPSGTNLLDAVQAEAMVRHMVADAPVPAASVQYFDPLAFGQRLREAREAKGLSLQGLADAANLSKAHVWELEQARSQNPGANALCDLASALDVSVVWLFVGVASPPPAGHVEPSREAIVTRARDVLDGLNRGVGYGSVAPRQWAEDVLAVAVGAGAGWRPIESAPMDGTPFLAYIPQASWHTHLKPTIATLYWAPWENFASLLAERIGETEGDMGDWGPTHWMPLPAPPGSDDPLQGEPGTARGQESSAHPEAAEMVGLREEVLRDQAKLLQEMASRRRATNHHSQEVADLEMIANSILALLSPSYSKESERG